MSILTPQIDSVRTCMPFGVSGQVQGISGLTIEAADLPLPLGSVCRVRSFGGRTALAEEGRIGLRELTRVGLRGRKRVRRGPAQIGCGELTAGSAGAVAGT